MSALSSVFGTLSDRSGLVSDGLVGDGLVSDGLVSGGLVSGGLVLVSGGLDSDGLVSGGLVNGGLLSGGFVSVCARTLTRAIAEKGTFFKYAKRCCGGRNGDLKGMVLSGWCVGGRFCDGPQTRIRRLYL